MFSPEFIRSAMESAPDATVIVDAGGTILFSNQRVEELFGYPPEQLTGLNVDMLLPERFRARHATHRERFAADKRARPMGAGLELFARRRDGTEFPVEISLSPIHDGQRAVIAAAIRDVTDRKRIEAELVAARETADRANLAKSRFLATASHDLRQPLQTLSLLNGMLRRLAMDRDIGDALSRQEQAIAAMSRLLNALLDISKLESGAIKPEPTDFVVATIFEEMRAEFAELAADKGLELQIEACGERVHSDPSLIEQILRNLVANAIKYTREGWVRLRGQHDAGMVRIEVLDSGVGITADQLPYIYDEFYQAGVQANAVREGYGLGLSIVQRLVKLLGLNLSVRSEVGKGSVFTLELPLSTGKGTDQIKTRSPAASAAARPVKLRHVLVVEDDPAILSATRMLLKVEGYRVTTAASLAEAVEKAREHRDVDVLVTDYHLGDGQTGADVITAVRGVISPKLKAILVTGDTSRAIKELSADDQLRVTSKPVDADELLSSLRTLIGS